MGARHEGAAIRPPSWPGRFPHTPAGRTRRARRQSRYQGKGRLICSSSERCSAMGARSEEHTSELQSLMRISYAVFCLKKKKNMTSTYALCIFQDKKTAVF